VYAKGAARRGEISDLLNGSPAGIRGKNSQGLRRRVRPKEEAGPGRDWEASHSSSSTENARPAVTDESTGKRMLAIPAPLAAGMESTFAVFANAAAERRARAIPKKKREAERRRRREVKRGERGRVREPLPSRPKPIFSLSLSVESAVTASRRHKTETLHPHPHRGARGGEEGTEVRGI